MQEVTGCSFQGLLFFASDSALALLRHLDWEARAIVTSHSLGGESPGCPDPVTCQMDIATVTVKAVKCLETYEASDGMQWFPLTAMNTLAFSKHE